MMKKKMMIIMTTTTTMDFFVLFSYITFTDCIKGHSRLLSITCHSLAIAYFVLH